jgi:hypothetical protein
VSPPVRRADDLLSRVDEARLRIARLRQRVRAIAGASGSE